MSDTQNLVAGLPEAEFRKGWNKFDPCIKWASESGRHEVAGTVLLPDKRWLKIYKISDRTLRRYCVKKSRNFKVFCEGLGQDRSGFTRLLFTAIGWLPEEGLPHEPMQASEAYEHHYKNLPPESITKGPDDAKTV